MKSLICWLSLCWMSIANAQHLPLVPQPAKMEYQAGEGMRLPAQLAVDAPAEWKAHLEIFGEHLERCTSGECELRFGAAGEFRMVVKKDDSLQAEEYIVSVASQEIEVTASTLKGLAHGTATLLQLAGSRPGQEWPLMQIVDRPAVPYRNFMIDMGRNPHSMELLKETIDLLWFYKVDSLQLHLTDDQRFAWPSTAYPKLWDGLISLAEFRELEAYAQVRGVTIIPELEVPGHSGILRQHYPEVFGRDSAELATSEKAFSGIKTLLDEMLEVFSSTPYIHIGGDEAYGVPVVAQRDLINKLHAYLQSKDRQTIVWEGPHVGVGDNKVNTDVIHINWRTIAYRPDEMLRDGYRVINAAWDPLYIVDHYPRINFTMTSPQHIYETLKLTRFKHVNPGIPTFAEPIDVASTDQLIGFCMPWWEGREENFFEQNVPRLVPFAEVAWNPSIKRDYAQFSNRAEFTEAARDAAYYPVTINAASLVVPSDGVFHHSTEIQLKAELRGSNAEIRYCLDGSAPTTTSQLYEKPFTLTQSAILRAAVFVDGVQLGHGSRRKLTAVVPEDNLALGKPVVSSASSGKPFSIARLTDGGTNNLGFYLGYPAEPEPIRVTVDLESVRQVGRIVVHAYSISNSAENYVVEVSSDGKTFQQVGSHLERNQEPERPSPQSAALVEFNFEKQDVQFVRVLTRGNKGYVFDSFSKLVEIQVFEE